MEGNTKLMTHVTKNSNMEGNTKLMAQMLLKIVT